MTESARLVLDAQRVSDCVLFAMRRLYRVPPREILVAEYVLENTTGAGKISAYLPVRNIALRTGIDARDLKTLPSRKRPGLIDRLFEKRILIKHAEADTYSFQPDDTRWTAKRRPISETEIQEVFEAIMAPSRGLTVAFGELGLEAVVRRLFTMVNRRGESPPVAVANDHDPGGSSPPAPVVVHHQTGGDLPPAYNRLPERKPETKPVTGNRRLVGQETTTTAGDAAYMVEKFERLLGAEAEGEMKRNGLRWFRAAREHPTTFSFMLRTLQDFRDAHAIRTSAARLANKIYQNKLHNRVPEKART